MPKIAEAPRGAPAWRNADGVRMLLSAHASHEELFLFRRAYRGAPSAQTGPQSITVSWRLAPKSQPPDTTFKVPAVDAPNVNGARMFGAWSRTDPGDAARRCRRVCAARGRRGGARLGAVCPRSGTGQGLIGDTQWIADARLKGHAAAPHRPGGVADELWPGRPISSCPVHPLSRKTASYTNDQGRLPGARRARFRPRARPSRTGGSSPTSASRWGCRFDYKTDAQVRADIESRFADVKGFAGLTGLSRFRQPVPARTWLQSSEPLGAMEVGLHVSGSSAR